MGDSVWSFRLGFDLRCLTCLMYSSSFSGMKSEIMLFAMSYVSSSWFRNLKVWCLL